MRVRGWLYFMCLHFCSAVPYFVRVLGCSLPFAMFKVRTPSFWTAAACMLCNLFWLKETSFSAKDLG